MDYWEPASQYPPGFGPGEPYYEPAHLRHRPGDDWQIGGRPHDPADPGPYGTPGWYQDRRTGRHRRGELPDPLPETAPEAVEGFSKLREEAYHAFLRDSEELHRAHYETAAPGRAVVRLRRLLHVLLGVLYWRVLPFPESPTARPVARRSAPKTANHDAYQAKRAAKRSSGRSGDRPPDRSSGRAARRPVHRPAPGPVPRTSERRRPRSGAGSAPEAFFGAVRAARAETRMAGGGTR